MKLKEVIDYSDMHLVKISTEWIQQAKTIVMRLNTMKKEGEN